MWCLERFLRRTLPLVRQKALIVLILGLAACQGPSNSKALVNSETILEEDKQVLDDFFRILMFQEDFAYVLLGHKPVAFTTYLKPVSKKNNWLDALFSFSSSNRKLKKGWETWSKYSFPHTSILFWEEPSSQTPNQFRLVIANRENFETVIEKNRQDFECILGKPISADTLLTKKHMFEAFCNHEALIGIILGYGHKNAWFFYQTRCIDKNPICLGRWDDTHPILKLPSFVIDPEDPETKKLKEIYERDREAILKYYEEKDFLQATLSLFSNR